MVRYLFSIVAVVCLFCACKTQRIEERSDLAAVGSQKESFKKTIETLERNGLKGSWLSSSIWPGMPNQAIYVVEKLPAVTKANSALVIQRTNSALAMARRLIDEGMTLALAVPPQGMADAICILKGQTPAPELVLATKKGSAAKANSIVILDPGGDEFVLAHEAQHWRDYQPSGSSNPSNYQKIHQLVFSFGGSLSDAELDQIGDTRFLDLIQIANEARGHQAMIKLAYERFKRKEPYFDADTKKISQFTPATLAAYEEKVYQQYFRPNYDGNIAIARSIFAKHPKDRVKTRKFFADFIKWDLPMDDEESKSNKISLKLSFNTLTGKR